MPGVLKRFGRKSRFWDRDTAGVQNTVSACWMGGQDSMAGVSVLVAEWLVNKVAQVTRVSERLIILKLVIGKCNVYKAIPIQAIAAHATL
jgi:hypothetical protein